jgi:hypothetical protein
MFGGVLWWADVRGELLVTELLKFWVPFGRLRGLAPIRLGRDFAGLIDSSEVRQPKHSIAITLFFYEGASDVRHPLCCDCKFTSFLLDFMAELLFHTTGSISRWTPRFLVLYDSFLFAHPNAES